MDSPRGRIYLMKSASEGRLPLTSDLVQRFDACLGCMACVTACPSGVQYGPLIEQTRAYVEQTYRRPLFDRVFRNVLFALLPYPRRMRFALAPLAIVGPILRTLRKSRVLRLLPSRVGAVLRVAPDVTWASLRAELPASTPAKGQRRLRVALLAGCVQRLAFASVNEATLRVLSAEGCDVLVPSGQGCCGALALHAGRPEQAKALARQVIAAFEGDDVDRIVVNAAGCGSSMKEYGHLLADDPMWSARARAFSERVRDVTEVLSELGPVAPRQQLPIRVAYHDACHLAHGQGVRAQPREILSSIPGLELVSPVESDTCCGSAGIYNLVQPEPASQLGERKARNLAAVNPDIVATANPGCTLQIIAAAEQMGHHWPVLHPVQILDAAIAGTHVPGLKPPLAN